MRQLLLEEIEYLLETRFGAEGLRLLPEIRKIQDVDMLKAIHVALKRVNGLHEIRRIYAQ